jgi:hypothetical protein
MLKFKAFNIIKIRYPNMDKADINKKADELIAKEKTKENIDKMLVIEQLLQKYPETIRDSKREYLNKLDIDVLRKKKMLNESHLKLNKEYLDLKLKDIREKYSLQNRVYLDNIDFISEYKKYIFFGHGWNTDKVFNIQNKQNVYIVILDSTVTCADSVKFDFIEKLNKSTNPLDYIKYVNDIAKKMHNDFCMYSSDSEFHIVPNMLISTYKNKNELNALIDIDTKTIKSDSNIMLLSELVETIGNNGNKFFLQIYACRSQIDTYQMKNIEIIEVKQYINNNNLTILNEGDIIENPKCSPFI